jgi:hypothetical protein
VCVNAYNTDDKIFQLKDFIFDIITFRGHLTIGDNGIAEEQFQPSYDYTPDEISGILEDLRKDKVLKPNGDMFYVDFD